MQKEVSVTTEPKEEKNQQVLNTLIFEALEKQGIKVHGHEIKSVFVKRSVDARHGQLKVHLRYKVFIDEDPENLSVSELPEWKNADGSRSVVVVGSGPAGLFASLRLLEDGIKPVIIERGEETQKRRQDIAKISTRGEVNPDSNYCFGEGGAGTFSDGKLYTRSNKRGNIDKCLQILVRFGADPKILTDAHPHIGTEKLPGVINAIREFIKEKGGEFYFHSKCTGFVDSSGSLIEKSGAAVKGVKIQNVFDGQEQIIKGDYVILATGHSANDIYELMAKTSPLSLEAKTFAVGVRVEHPRTLIDSIQYHGKGEGLPAAEYRLTTQVEERGVYSFCMCPGGFVVPSSSSPDEIVVNGMSASGRNSKWSNAAIVVETRPEDIPEEFVERAKLEGCKALAGLHFRKWLETETKRRGEGQKAPCQIMTDFIHHKDSKELPETSYTPGVVSSRLDLWLPEQISGRLAQGFLDFGKNMKGFVTKDSVLIASETRTSTPVRILRDSETLECEKLPGLFPCGEGSGYSGGIVSSAMDGEKSAAAISKLCRKN